MNEEAPLSSNILQNLSTLPGLVVNVTSQFLVRPTGNPNEIGVSGFLFNIIGTEEMSLDSEITDHYTESNVSIQDQIALRPERFTLSGYQGELVNEATNPFISILTSIASFGVVPGVTPTFVAQATQTYNQVNQVAQSVGNIINEAQSIFDLFTGLSTTANNQQMAFQYFYQLWLNKQLCEVETPWGILENMAIESLRAKQDEVTRMVSEFSVTFKAIRFAETSTSTSTGADLSSVSGRAQQALQNTSNPTNSGSTAGTPTDNSVLTQQSSLLNSLQQVN